MLEPALFGLKVLFLALLFLFIFMIVRRLTGDLDSGAEPVTLPPRPEPAPRPEPPPRAPAPEAETSGKTAEFEELVSGLNPRLVVQSSTVLEKGREFRLRGGATIGRSPASDIVLADEFVSQTHARIFPRKQFLFIEDLGSLNGTFVDGRRVEGEHQIKPGQELVIGDTIFRYEE